MVTTVCVFDPSPLLTVTIEVTAGADDIHFHAGGQGFWVARMARRLGAEPTLVGSLGGETGTLLAPLIESAGVGMVSVPVAGRNGSYVQDRRSGTRVAVASSQPLPLTRHEVDDLYGAALAAALHSDVAVLAGPCAPDVIPPEFYLRLATDLGTLDMPVVADVSGDALRSVLEGGVDVLKVSDEDMRRDGILTGSGQEADLQLVRDLHEAGARAVILTRADRPAIAIFDDRFVLITGPRLQPVDHRGAGDAMTGAVAVGLSRGMPMEDALRLGAAAGAASVTRRGLASGQPDAVSAILDHVELQPIA